MSTKVTAKDIKINLSSLMSNLCNMVGTHNRNNMNSSIPNQYFQPVYVLRKRWEQ